MSAGRSRGSTFAGFTEKIRDKIAPAPVNLADPGDRSDLAKELQPESVSLDDGEFFTDIGFGKKSVTVKMNKNGIMALDAATNNVLDEFEWIHIADFRVAKNKKVFAIMHDTFKDGSKLLRVEFKTKDSMRMLGTATKCVDVLAAQMAAARDAAEVNHEHEHKKSSKKGKKNKSGLGQHTHSPRGDADDADADADADGSESEEEKAKPKAKKEKNRRGTRTKKANDDAPDADDEETAEKNADDADVPEKKKKAKERRGTRSKKAAGESPLLEKKKKNRARGQTVL
eukprot:TRINITY_DN1610_c0_g1_i2.p1 TRINITY_DN1610_c0_g1~~TRINITY_DN1610_c0_g1_i2.p1  ORF type:complete len:299 (-),score=156.78 TRINITY_DN1610_c0_g1_i2:18-872(-)